MLVEFSSPRRRGLWLGILSFYFSSGSFVTAVLGWLILPAFSVRLGWRVLCVVLGVACCVAAAFRWFVPETPAYLGTY